VPLPSEADVDSLFAFAREAKVEVIYTLRLRDGSREYAARMARYIIEHHQDGLTCFAIGNEPNVFAQEYPVYLAEWKRYVAQISARSSSQAAKLSVASNVLDSVANGSLLSTTSIAPASRQVAKSGGRAIAVTLAPHTDIIWRANVPRPPAALWMSTRFPAAFCRVSPAPRTASHMVTKLYGSAASA